MRLLVHDSRFQPSGPEWFTRWRFRSEGGGPSGWSTEGAGFRHRLPDQGSSASVVDWIEYQHIDPDRSNYGPVRDFIAYNGARLGSGRRVYDLAVETQLGLTPGVELLSLEFRAPRGTLRFMLPLDGSQPPRADYRGQVFRTDEEAARVAADWADRPGPRRLEASFFDHRLLVALDGVPLFEPLDLEPGPPAPPPPADAPPVALGVVGQGLVIDWLKVYRDVFYTEGLSHAPGRPFSVGEPYPLGPDEYFVLGDNSPVSNDSRFWRQSPAVPGSMLMGKPFLVHLPSRGVPIRLFRGEPYWVPDPREIRYIR
jgi:signal peptidase I